MISKFLEDKKDEILKTICDVIRIPSISDENKAEPGMPFGKQCNTALEYVLNLAKSMGFRTKNIDGYCGYVEFGEGNELLGIIGHLDVVPAGDGWTKCSPFEPIIQGNKLYGRGAIDDKGPVIASLYAMKYVMDTMHVNKRVRLIIGLNEEVSWKCIEYYKQHEEIPTVGFSPDADFPVIYAEKGFLNCYISQKYDSSGKILIKNIICDNAINIVPKYAEAVLVLSDVDVDKLINAFTKLVEQYNFHMSIQKLSENEVKLIAEGVSVHSAHLDLGINALSRLLLVIDDLQSMYNTSVDIINFVSKHIGTTLFGEKLGIDCDDESGKLTLNVSNIKYENDSIILGLNLRIPVTIYPAIIKQKINDASLEYNNLSVEFADEKAALYVPKNNTLVTTLCSVFNEVTGQNAEPITCSGATYARAFENVVSFGCNMPGNIDMCHQADEYINIDDLLTSIEIYIKAIRKLAS